MGLGIHEINPSTTQIDAVIDDEAIVSELLKVPKSDSNVSWNATALGAINAEVDTALNTAIPGTNTADSVNDVLLDQLKPRLPAAGTIATTADLLTSGDILAYRAVVTSGGATTGFVASTMASYGVNFFVGWTAYIVCDTAGAAPAREFRVVETYTTASGTFAWTPVLSAALANGDIVFLIHPSIDLTIIGLDHLLALTDGANNYPNNAVAGSVIAKILSKAAAGATPSGFDCTTDSLEAISDAISTVDGLVDSLVSDQSISVSYYVNNITGNDTWAGTTWATAVAQVNQAITLSEVNRLARAANNQNVRNRIFVQGTGTAYATLTVEPNYCDIIGLGGDPRGNGAGIARIGPDDTTLANGTTFSGGVRGVNFENLQFQCSSGYTAFEVDNLYRCHFENCAFMTNGASGAGPAPENGGLAPITGILVGKGSGVTMHNCHWGTAGGSDFVAGISVTGTHWHNCKVSNCHIVGATGVLLSANITRADGSSFKDCYIGGCMAAGTIGFHDNTTDGMVVLENCVIEATTPIERVVYTRTLNLDNKLGAYSGDGGSDANDSVKAELDLVKTQADAIPASSGSSTWNSTALAAIVTQSTSGAAAALAAFLGTKPAGFSATPFTVTKDLHNDTGTYDVATCTTQPVIVEVLTAVNVAAVQDDVGGITSISIQSDNTTAQTFMSSTEGAKANLTAESQPGNFAGCCYMAVGDKIQLTINGGTADANPSNVLITILYTPVVTGGYLS